MLDMSVLPRSHEGDERHVIGMTGDLLKSHRSRNGKILNALDFPMPTRGVRPPETIATDILAFNKTLDDPYCKRTTAFPVSDMYWALAATDHSFHFFHIDTDGLGTLIAPKTGKKHWILARPKAGRSFAQTDIYVDGKYAIDEMNMDIWDVEAILLTPGMCLYVTIVPFSCIFAHDCVRFMKPNTPHLVLTPQASICHGGHFYASSTLRSSCHGILHTFIACSLLTNTEHTTASRELLRRLLGFYSKAFFTDYVTIHPTGKTINRKYRGHIPDIFTFDGLLDVLSLCNLMELGNVIHYKTYTTEGMGSSERRRMIMGRIISHQVREWLAANIEIYDPSATTILRSLDRDVFYHYLGSQAAALVHYRKHAPISGATGHVDFRLEDLVSQITQNLAHHPQFREYYDLAVDPKTFDWVGAQFQVRPASGPCKPKILAYDGKTLADHEWLSTQEALTIIKGIGQDLDDNSQPIQGGGKLRIRTQDKTTADDINSLQDIMDTQLVEQGDISGEGKAGGHRRKRARV